MNRRSFFKSLFQGVAVAAAMTYCPRVLIPPKVQEAFSEFIFPIIRSTLPKCPGATVQVQELPYDPVIARRYADHPINMDNYKGVRILPAEEPPSADDVISDYDEAWVRRTTATLLENQRKHMEENQVEYVDAKDYEPPKGRYHDFRYGWMER